MQLSRQIASRLNSEREVPKNLVKDFREQVAKLRQEASNTQQGINEAKSVQKSLTDVEEQLFKVIDADLATLSSLEPVP